MIPPASVPRLCRCVLIAMFIALSWLMMMAAHECGHILGAWFTGGRVVEVSLHPLAFSYTRIDPNPNPLMVAWMGPVLGAAIPLALLIAWRAARVPGDLLVRWFAGFCLIANGAYLGVGWVDRVGDAGDLLRHGAATWQLVLFGGLCVPIGLLLWHRTGPAFGLRAAKKRDNARFLA